MAKASTPGDIRSVPSRWVGLDEQPILFATQFLGQIDDLGEILLSIGQASPPLITGTTSTEIAKQVEGITSVPVRPVARLMLTRDRAEDLKKVLEDVMTIQDRQQPMLRAGRAAK